MEATLGAVRVRFRPVMMTSLAFFFGAGEGRLKAVRHKEIDRS